VTADWMVRRREIHDPQLRQRVIDIVDRAVANALPGQAESDTHDGVKHTAVWWSWQAEGDTSAQKTTHPDGFDYELTVEHDDGPGDGPWAFVRDRDGDTRVLWMPGLGFEELHKFLAWWEDES
jgi:hypothetical protein